MFSKKMAFVYGGLSVCALIGFVVTMKMVDDYGLGIPIEFMPVTHIVQPLFFTGIVFGGLATLCHWGMDKSTVGAVFAVGILLTGMFNFFLGPSLFFDGPSHRLANVVIYSEKVRNYNLGHDVILAQTLCTSTTYLVDVYENTKIYEQSGDAQEKRQVELDALQPGLVVDIKGNEWVDDPEFHDFWFDKYNPGITDNYYYLIGATEITIHKGETAPVETNMSNDNCYGFMSAP